MATRKHTAPKAAARRPNLDAILGNLGDACSVLECAYTAIDSNDSSEIGDEAVCLRHGLDLLRSVYTELDMAIPSAGTGLSDSNKPPHTPVMSVNTKLRGKRS